MGQGASRSGPGRTGRPRYKSAEPPCVGRGRAARSRPPTGGPRHPQTCRHRSTRWTEARLGLPPPPRHLLTSRAARERPGQPPCPEQPKPTLRDTHVVPAHRPFDRFLPCRPPHSRATFTDHEGPGEPLSTELSRQTAAPCGRNRSMVVCATWGTQPMGRGRPRVTTLLDGTTDFSSRMYSAISRPIRAYNSRASLRA